MSFERPMTKRKSTSAIPTIENALVRLARDRPAADPLGDREGDVAAVERQERQQVQEREREADERQHLQVVAEADLERLARDGGDADDARHLVGPSR